jgi:hypothetical protein
VRGNGSGSFRARDIVAVAEVCRDDDARDVDGLRDPQKTDHRFVTSEPKASGREVHRITRRP